MPRGNAPTTSDTSSESVVEEDVQLKKVWPKEWKRQWDSDPRWISAMLQAAAGDAHICEFWKLANKFGAKRAFWKKLERKLRRKLAPVKDEKLHEGRVMQERVEAIVAAWAAGDARKKRDGVNDSMWQATASSGGGAGNPRQYVTITC
eukprot:jgi/Tetstr1/436278/TSEL_025120.t1